MLRTASNQMLEFDQNVSPSIYPPLEAYYLIPEGDSLSLGQGKKTVRFIYEGATIYSSYQEQQLQAFEQKLRAIHMKIPDLQYSRDGSFPRSSILRWLQGVNYNVEKCIKCLEEHFQWAKANLPKQVTSRIYQTLKSGVFYIHGRDHKFRPCLVWNARVIKTISVQDMMEGFIYVLDYAKRNLFIPGQIENWLSIMDCSKLSVGAFPRKRMQPTIHALQNNFRARQFHIFSLNVGAGIRFLYALASPFLEKAVKKKLTMYGGMKCKKLMELFNPCQLEQRFGGTAPNVENSWQVTLKSRPPIVMPEGPCATEQTVFVSKERHSEILRQDRRWVRPPISRERYHDIYKPLEQRLEEGEDLVLTEEMERALRTPILTNEFGSLKNPAPIIEDSKEDVQENEQKEQKEASEGELSEDPEQGNVDYETTRKHDLLQSFSIRSLIQTRIENSLHKQIESAELVGSTHSFARKPDNFKPSILEKRESILIGQLIEEDQESEPNVVQGIEERLEDSIGDEQQVHCSDINFNDMKESSREELIEYKDVIPQIEVEGANVTGISNTESPHCLSGHEHEATQISTPKPLSGSIKKYSMQPRKPVIKPPPNKGKSAKCCEIF